MKNKSRKRLMNYVAQMYIENKIEPKTPLDNFIEHQKKTNPLISIIDKQKEIEKKQ